MFLHFFGGRGVKSVPAASTRNAKQQEGLQENVVWWIATRREGAQLHFRPISPTVQTDLHNMDVRDILFFKEDALREHFMADKGG